MQTETSSPIRTGSNADLAFAVVVLASYLATFSSYQPSSLVLIGVLIGLGVAYIANGIYGYGFCVRSGNIGLQLAYFASQLLLGGAIVFLGQGAGFNSLLLLPLAAHAVVMLPQRYMYWVSLAIVLTYLLAVSSLPEGWTGVWIGLPVFFAGLVFIFSFTQMAVGEERARGEVDRLIQELTDANQQLREYAVQVEELAITKERNRLAREIHDGLGHYLTTSYMQLQAGRAILKKNPVAAEKLLQKGQDQIQAALDDVRNSVAALRANTTDQLPLPKMIEDMLQRSEGNGITYEFKMLGTERPVSPQVHLTMFRATQEAINNTNKHAHASRMWIKLDYTQSDTLQLLVRDDGVGAEKIESGFGLLGLRERVALLDGKMSIETISGQGFGLEIMVPA